MKAKVKRGTSFKDLLDYLFGEDKSKKNDTGHIIGGNMTGLTTLDLTTEFETAASLRPEKSKVCLHFSLRMPQGHDVDDLTWNQIAVRFMEKMNLSSNRPWLLVKHPDEHVHIATSRIDLDGNVWHGKFEALKAIKATHELEQEFHLKLTPTLTTTDLFKTRLTDLEIKKKAARSESELLPREKLAEIIANAIESSVGSFKCFTWHLQQSNVSLRLNRAKNTDHVSGISFVYNGLPYKGSKIARAYSYQGILKLIEKKKSKTIPGQNRPAFFGASPTFPNITAPTPVAAALETIPASSPMPSASIPEIPAVIPKSSTPPVVSIVPILPILQPTAISPAQRHPADEAIVVVANPAVNIVEPTNTPIPTIVQPVSIPRTIQTLQDIDPKLWRHDANSWPTVQKMLIEQLQLDPELISDLFIKGRLWFMNGSTLATARLALPARKMVGVTLLPLVPKIHQPTIIVPDQNGLFTTGDVYSHYQRVVVTRNAIEAISYQQLSKSGCPDTPAGLVVSADGELPPLWLVNFVKKAKKKLLLATKTKELFGDALPGVIVNDKWADWFELDVSRSSSWHELLIERANDLKNVQAKDNIQK